MSQQPACLSSPNVVVVWVLLWSGCCGGLGVVAVWVLWWSEYCGGLNTVVGPVASWSGCLSRLTFVVGRVALWSECVSGLGLSAMSVILCVWQTCRDGRVVELADTQDLKSCEHCARAGSSPASATSCKFQAPVRNSMRFSAVL